MVLPMDSESVFEKNVAINPPRPQIWDIRESVCSCITIDFKEKQVSPCSRTSMALHCHGSVWMPQAMSLGPCQPLPHHSPRSSLLSYGPTRHLFLVHIFPPPFPSSFRNSCPDTLQPPDLQGGPLGAWASLFRAPNFPGTHRAPATWQVLPHVDPSYPHCHPVWRLRGMSCSQKG